MIMTTTIIKDGNPIKFICLSMVLKVSHDVASTYLSCPTYSLSSHMVYPSPAELFSSVQFSHSVMSDSLQPHELQHTRPPCPSSSQSLLKLMPTESVTPSSHLILCRPLLLLPPIPPSIRVFSNESTLRMRWPKYWSFSFSISSSNEHPGLVSFTMDWLDLLVVQGTLKSLLQHQRKNVPKWASLCVPVSVSECPVCPSSI